MKKIKIMSRIIAVFMCTIFMCSNVCAREIDLSENTAINASSDWQAVMCRYVFDYEHHDIDAGVFTPRFIKKNGEEVIYFDLELISLLAAYIENNGDIFAKPKCKTDESNSFVTVEQKDAYSKSNVYFTVWFNSKKLRLNGHDLQLKYDPVFIGEDDKSWFYLSKEDISAIYGYDINFWGEKNTFYFKRNGKGYLQTCTEATAPKATAKTTQSKSKASSRGGYATYPTSLHIPDFTAVTGISGQKDELRINCYNYYHVSQTARDKYFSALLAAGFKEISSDSTRDPVHNLVFAKKAYIYGTPPNNVQSQLIIAYTVENDGVLTIAFNPENYSVS